LADVKTIHIGEGTRIWQFVVILPEARIGNDCNICSHCFIESDVVIGDRTTVKNGVQIWDGVRISDDVFVGPNVTFTNDLLPRSRRHPGKFLRTEIRDGASIGANATILCGNKIGRWALIGAGSVVTENVPDYAIYFGNPAKIRGFICQCGNKLKFDVDIAECSCGLVYALSNGGLECKRI